MMTRKKLAKDLMNTINDSIPRETAIKMQRYDLGDTVHLSYYGEKPEYFRNEMLKIIRGISTIPLYKDYWFIDRLKIESLKNEFYHDFSLISTYKGKQKNRYDFILVIDRYPFSSRIKPVGKEVYYHELSFEARALLGNKLFYDYNDVFNAEMNILKEYINKF